MHNNNNDNNNNKLNVSKFLHCTQLMMTIVAKRSPNKLGKFNFKL